MSSFRDWQFHLVKSSDWRVTQVRFESLPGRLLAVWTWIGGFVAQWPQASLNLPEPQFLQLRLRGWRQCSAPAAAAAAKVASVVSDSVRPHRRQPTRLPRPWDSPGRNTGVGWPVFIHAVMSELPYTVFTALFVLHECQLRVVFISICI